MTSDAKLNAIENIVKAAINQKVVHTTDEIIELIGKLTSSFDTNQLS
jgi:hypothetical protein